MKRGVHQSSRRWWDTNASCPRARAPSTPGRDSTCDLSIRSRTLCVLSYGGKTFSVVCGIRTRVTGLRDQRPSQLNEHDRRTKNWCARQESNLRAPGCRPDDLPLIYAHKRANEGTRTLTTGLGRPACDHYNTFARSSPSPTRTGNHSVNSRPHHHCATGE